MLDVRGRDFGAVDDGVSPTIASDVFGKHFGAHTVPVARDRVDDQFQSPTFHAPLTSLLLEVRPGIGSTRGARVREHGPRR